MSHIYKATDTPIYFIAHGGETEWTPAVPAVEHVPEVEATYSETEVDEMGEPLMLTPYIPEVVGVEGIPAKAPRVHIGKLDVGLTVTSGQPLFELAADTAELLEKTDGIDLTEHNPIPKQGERVEAGLYTFGDSMVVCRQAHVRTEHDPHTVPALFSFYRDSAEGLEWMEMEKVEAGETRTFGMSDDDEPVAIVYEAIQAHTTQLGWEPDKTPALWQLVAVGGEIGEWTQPTAENPYMIGDQVLFNGKTYESIIDNNVWSPSGYPAGWTEVI